MTHVTVTRAWHVHWQAAGRVVSADGVRVGPKHRGPGPLRDCLRTAPRFRRRTGTRQRRVCVCARARAFARRCLVCSVTARGNPQTLQPQPLACAPTSKPPNRSLQSPNDVAKPQTLMFFSRSGGLRPDVADDDRLVAVTGGHHPVHRHRHRIPL
eukprot:2353555-Rhodomonas_salina.3